MGDRPDRRLLPVHARAGLRRRGASSARTGSWRPQAAQNSAAPLLAFELGGVVLLGVISAVAFATILAVVAGLTITASTSFAHDVYASVMKSHEVTEDEQVRVSRITAVVLGIAAIGLGILANGQNVAFLVALAFAIAAAANLPTIVYSLYWPRFNTRGALWSMYGGLISTLVLIVFSPAVSGSKTAMLPNAGLRVVPAVPIRASCRSRWRSSWASSAR